MLWRAILTGGLVMGITACNESALKAQPEEEKDMENGKVESAPGVAATAVFAGGCFWCMEPPFEKMEGVISVVSGYTGGEEPNPTYQQVSAGKTGHLEAVQITYDPEKVTYEALLKTFWRSIDPTDPGGQFADRGHQYQTAIFYSNDKEKILAEQSKKVLDSSGKFDKPVATAIRKASAFFPAERYHQDYYLNNPTHYSAYAKGSGRKGYLEATWKGDDSTGSAIGYQMPPDSTLRNTLTPLQYQVARKNGTEPPFKNEYWDNKKAGIYVDVVSGEPLFASVHKFESGTGWPSFTRPLASEHVVEVVDKRFGMTRTEVRSLFGDSHLGHVFPDGPAPTGLRYCINSASLRFVPADKLEETGYGEFKSLFKTI